METRDNTVVIKQTRLADIEDAAVVGPNSNIVGLPVGNQMWRSPEAHCEGRVNKPSDMFSFAIVVGYRTSFEFLTLLTNI